MKPMKPMKRYISYIFLLLFSIPSFSEVEIKTKYNCYFNKKHEVVITKTKVKEMVPDDAYCIRIEEINNTLYTLQEKDNEGPLSKEDAAMLAYYEREQIKYDVGETISSQEINTKILKKNLEYKNCFHKPYTLYVTSENEGGFIVSRKNGSERVYRDLLYVKGEEGYVRYPFGEGLTELHMHSESVGGFIVSHKNVGSDEVRQDLLFVQGKEGYKHCPVNGEQIPEGYRLKMESESGEGGFIIYGRNDDSGDLINPDLLFVQGKDGFVWHSIKGKIPADCRIKMKSNSRGGFIVYGEKDYTCQASPDLLFVQEQGKGFVHFPVRNEIPEGYEIIMDSKNEGGFIISGKKNDNDKVFPDLLFMQGEKGFVRHLVRNEIPVGYEIIMDSTCEGGFIISGKKDSSDKVYPDLFFVQGEEGFVNYPVRDLISDDYQLVMDSTCEGGFIISGKKDSSDKVYPDLFFVQGKKGFVNYPVRDQIPDDYPLTMYTPLEEGVFNVCGQKDNGEQKNTGLSFVKGEEGYVKKDLMP